MIETSAYKYIPVKDKRVSEIAMLMKEQIYCTHSVRF